jgi:small subunit ribosomal protein S20
MFRPAHSDDAKVATAPRTAPRLSFAMANIHSQKKRILRSERERLENRRYTSKIKTYFRRLERAVAAGEEEGADSEHRALVQTIDKAVKRGALHRNTGARKKSRAARIRHGAAEG